MPAIMNWASRILNHAAGAVWKNFAGLIVTDEVVAISVEEVMGIGVAIERVVVEIGVVTGASSWVIPPSNRSKTWTRATE